MNLDILTDILQEVLNCACTSLESGICLDGDSSPCGCPCNVFITAGPVVWDHCCGEGSLSIGVDRIYQYKQFPNPSGEPSVCATELAADVTLTLLRCWPANLHEDGTSPNKTEIQNASVALYRDMVLLTKSSICCLQAKGKTRPFVFNGARVVGPEGGCAGVTVQFTVPVY